MNCGLMSGWNGPGWGWDIFRPVVCVNVWVLHGEMMLGVVWMNYSKPFLFVCFSALWLQQWPIYRDVYCSTCWPFLAFVYVFTPSFSMCFSLFCTNVFVHKFFLCNIISRCVLVFLFSAHIVSNFPTRTFHGV